MFKKIVSNLPFSPGIVGQLGFYLKRLRQEEFMRRIGMIFTALSVAVQIISLAIPPSHAQASSTNNIVYEAVSSKEHLLSVWDKGDTYGHKDIDDIFKYYGLTRKDIQNSTLTTMKSNDTFDGYELWTMGRKAFGKTNEYAQIIPTNEGSTTVYVRPWAKAWGVYSTSVLRGKTAAGINFAVILDCGNLVIAKESPKVTQPPLGEYSITCDLISGWAVDPRLKTTVVRVIISIDGKMAAKLDADEVSAAANNKGYPGNHGFNYAIPKYLLDGKDHTVTIVAYKDETTASAGEESAILKSLTIPSVIKGSCKPPTKITVCRPGVGIVTNIEEKDVLPTDYRDLAMCGSITVCVNDKLVSIFKYQDNGQARECPTISVCRDGVITVISTDQKKNTDLDKDECDEMQVCLNHALVVIQKKDFDASVHTNPELDAFGNPVCNPPGPNFNRSKIAFNLTQDKDATKTLARPGDTILYELTTANTGNLDGVIDIEEDLEDILEYSTLINMGGGNFNEETNYLSWSGVNIKAGENIVKSFKVKILAELPATATNQGNRDSFDFEMINVYGNAVKVKLPKPVSKHVEEFAGSLPNTGPGENTFFVSLFVALVFFFYFRNRLVTKELLILRKDFRGA